eukprot:symbB.v1.2.022629.t1/scaffold2014.1/size92328/8
MWVLLLSGTFLDSPSVALNEVGATSGWLVALFLVFIFLSHMMVLNMLIGILCDVFFVKRSNFVGSDGRKPVQTADASGIIDAEIKKPQLRLEHRAAQSFPPASSAIPKA